MNILAIIAGILLIIAAGVHAFIGASEFRLIKPTDFGKTREVWVQALSGWHWVSIDLFLSALVLLVVGVSDVIDAEETVLLLIGIYFGLCGIAWLVTVLVSGKGVARSLLKLPQWLFCFFIAGLSLAAR